MKIYISGAITNNPNYKEQFKAAEDRLKALGHMVINPATNQGYTYKEYIDTGLFKLMHCEAIYLLKGYEHSTGATLEHDYARTVGLKVFIEEDESKEERLLRYIKIAQQLKCDATIRKEDIDIVCEALERASGSSHEVT